MDSRVQHPVALRILRPYASVDDLLDSELDAFSSTGLVLLGAPQKPEGVIIRFQLCLIDGAIAMHGEGRVLGYRAQTAQSESALMVRFTRLDARSKELLDRAMRLRASSEVELEDDDTDVTSIPPVHAAPPRPSVSPPASVRSSVAPPVSRPPPSVKSEVVGPKPAASRVVPTGTKSEPARTSHEAARAIAPSTTPAATYPQSNAKSDPAQRPAVMPSVHPQGPIMPTLEPPKRPLVGGRPIESVASTSEPKMPVSAPVDVTNRNAVAPPPSATPVTDRTNALERLRVRHGKD
jgi:hypothetical protein